MQLPRRRNLQQLIVWSLTPQEEGQPRRELEIAEWKCPGVDVAGVLIGAEQELRADENRRDDLFDTRIKSAAATSPYGFSESMSSRPPSKYRHQRIDVRRRDRTTGTRRARGSRRSARRTPCPDGPAHEDLSPARRLRHAGRVERPLDAHAANHARSAIAAAELVAGQEADEFVRLDARPLDERDADVVGPGLHLHRDVREALHDRRARRRAALIDQLQVLGSAQRLAKHFATVDEDDDGVTGLDGASVEVDTEVTDG